jgi:excisionase family DNA binding protein
MQTITPITPAVLTVNEGAQYVGCGRSTLYDYISARRLPTIKHGRKTVVRVADLDRLLQELAEESAA